jgi:hypothetical protein
VTEQVTTPTATSRSDRPSSRWGQLAAGIATIAILAGGVLLVGNLASTETVAMLLTGVWFAVALVAAAVVIRRRRHLAVPVGGGYAVTALAVVILLGLPQLRDREVNEQVVTGAPARPAADDDAGDDTAEDDGNDTAGDDTAEDDGNVQLSTGEFMGLAHPGSGTASIVEVAGGGRVLTLTEFSTDDGPDLRVYLTTDDPAQGDIGDFVDLGALRGNRGDQQYEIDADVDVEQYRYAVVWCRAFTVGFASAELAPS